MKILHIITRLIYGGAQQNTVMSCQAHAKAGHEVFLAYGPVYGPEGSLVEEAKEAGARSTVINSMERSVAPRKDYATYRALRKLIRRIQPDVVHTHSSKAGIVGRAAAWKQRVPAVIHTIHGLPFHEGQSAIKRNLFIKAERFAAKRCHKLIGITQAMCDTFKANNIGQAEQFTVVPSGVDIELWENPTRAATGFPNNAKLRDEIRFQLGVPLDATVVGIVARFDPLKGHADLIRIAPQLIEKYPKLRLLFVGDGWHRTQVEAAVQEAGIGDRVLTTGFVQLRRVALLYRAMDVMVLPSYQEGQSRTLLESLLSGCPIVGYDVGGIPEVCLDKETGLLVPLGDTDQLHATIEQTIDNPDASQERTARGKLHARDHFSNEVMTDQLERIYHETLEANSASKPDVTSE